MEPAYAVRWFKSTAGFKVTDSGSVTARAVLVTRINKLDPGVVTQVIKPCLKG
jgi:hypothetical protein